MIDPDELFADFDEPTPPTTPDPEREPCHFTVQFERDGLWCEDRWGASTQYYCGPCMKHNKIRP